ncbi:MAG: RHS repeat protein [Clostridia bacterium]|nr:RHS repeat protein [Clostridia bacterium]
MRFQQPSKELLFSNATEEWQYVSIIIPITDYAGYVTVSLVNSYNYTDVCFGGVTAEYVTGLGDYSDRSQYLYDGLGRVIYEKSFSGGEKTYSYSDNSFEFVDQTVYKDKKGNITTVDYTYNNTQNPFAVTQTTETFEPNSTGTGDIVTATYYTYNSHGSLIELKTLTDGTQTAHSMYSYTSNGRFLEKETDTAGRYITYSYQSTTGDLLSVTDGDGKVTSYTYDSYGRLTNETEGSASLDLSYGQYNINISHNGFSYSIGTDNAGNRTSFTILDSNGDLNRTMASYTYGGALGQISRLSYGNSQNKYYGYDSLGNLTFIAYTQNATIDTATFAWYYDQNGNVVKYVDRSDSSNPVTREYSYNPEGNLKYVMSSDGNSVLYHHSTTTNTDYEIFTTASTGNVYNYYISRNDAAKTITKRGTLGTKTIAYDSLGRISSAVNGSVTKSYDYKWFFKDVIYNNQQYSLRNETALLRKKAVLFRPYQRFLIHTTTTAKLKPFPRTVFRLQSMNTTPSVSSYARTIKNLTTDPGIR